MPYSDTVAVDAEGQRIGLTVCVDCGSLVPVIAGHELVATQVHDDWHRRFADHAHPAHGSPSQEALRG